MSFYRTYRPQVIDEIDNAAVRNQLQLLLTKEKSKLPHAYFFTGPKGAGKTTAARIIAKLFNCQQSTKGGPCGKCTVCMAIADGASLDVLEIDAASNRGIDEMRELKSNIGLAPIQSEYKIYIIDEVHMLTTEAFNALLKTLEEPPIHAVFVLATTDAHKVPATITSRCMVIQFSKASQEELLAALKRITKAEDMKISEDALKRIADVSTGAFRDSVKFLEQVSFHKGKIEKADIDAILALSTSLDAAAFLAALYRDTADATQRTKDSFDMLQKIDASGVDIKIFVGDILEWLHQALLAKATGGASASDFVTLTMDDIKDALVIFTKAFNEIKLSPIARLPVELAIVEIAQRKKPTGDAPSIIQPVAPKELEPKSEPAKRHHAGIEAPPAPQSPGLLSLEKLVDHWPDVIAATKPYNHSIAGVLRSSRPKAVASGIVTIEAFYKFHQEKLSTMQVRQMLADLLKKLFGETVKVEVVLGNKIGN